MARPLPHVAVLLAARNDESFLATTLIALFAELADYRAAGGAATMCVVNDGSTDRTAALLDAMRHESPVDTRVITRSESRGPAYALSEAFVAASPGADLVLRADADARFIQAGWLRVMTTCLTADERVGVVAPISLHADGAVDAHGVNYLPGGRTLDLHDRQFPEQPVAPLVEADAVLGVYSLMRVADWDIDTAYSTWRDDEDQCLALRRRGRRCFSLGTHQVVHYHRMRWARVSDRVTIGQWQRKHQGPRRQVQATRWAELRQGTELVAAGVLPGAAKRALRTVVPPPPTPPVPQIEAESARAEAAWRQNSQLFAHKWGFPAADPWPYRGPDTPRPSTPAEPAVVESRAGHLLADRYTPQGVAEAGAIIARALDAVRAAGRD